MKDSYSDEEIIDAVLKGGRSFEDISVYLFEAFKGYIPTLKSKLHLPQEQLEDAYADSLVKLIRQVRNNKFRGDSKISSYFYSIYYNACVDVSRKNTSHKNMATAKLFEHDAREIDLLKLLDAKDEARIVVQSIETMGDICQRILMDWGYYGYKMEEIAIRNNLKSAESARSMKYKCLKKLKELLAANQIRP